MKSPLLPRCLAIVGLAVAALTAARADQIPNPIVTASARPFNASFVATNLFDTQNLEYASLGQAAVSTPFTTNVLDGTWVELDFGDIFEFDRFVLKSRANAADIIGQSRLIFSDDPIFDATDRIFTFDPTGFNGAGFVQNLNQVVTGRYVRWEVITSIGSSRNLGGNQMWFLRTASGLSPLPPPVVINSTAPFNATYVAANAVNNDYGTEYASLGGQGSTFLDFDFGAATAIRGFEFVNRFSDLVTTFDLIFADTPDFSSPVATQSYTASDNGNAVTSASFDAVIARYVRLQATGFSGAVNTGAREIQFFTGAGQPPTITKAPTGATRLAGDAFILSAAAVGDIPLTFQWLRDGNPVPGATKSSLSFTNLLASDTGGYQIVATNPNGSATSAPPAMLTVLDPPVDITSDLRLLLKFDETDGLVAIDDSGSARDGTLSGFPGDDSQWVAGRINGAVRVNPDGAAGDDVVLVADDGGLDFSGSLEFTLAAWVNGPAAQEAGGAVFAKGTGGGGEQFAIDVPNGAYRFFVRAASGAATVYQTTVKPNDTWQHLAAVFSVPLNRVKFYVNGAEVLNGTPPASLFVNSHDVSLGSRQATAGAYDLNLNGRIDDARIYGRALTAADVLELFNQASLIPPTIVTPPAGGTVLAFENVTLSVAVDGSAPLYYQWKKDGAPIANATNGTFTLAGATAADAGSYTVTVTNKVGTATSDAAVIVVSDPPADLTLGLMLYLKLDETSGTIAIDSSGSAHDGTLQGFDEDPWTTGIINGAVAFNPEGAIGDDVILVPDDGSLSFSSTLEYSFSAWVNGDPSQEAGGAVLCKGTGAGGEQYCFDAFNGLRFFGWTGANPPTYILSSGVALNNTWQHAVGVFSRPQNRLKLYVNGVEVANGTPPASIVSNNHDVSIGSRQLSSGPYDLNFNGKIDDVRIYNRPLTPREVKYLYEYGIHPELIITRSGNQVTISWPPSYLSYSLEFTEELPAVEWNPVEGVVNNSITLSADGVKKFFRLIKP